MRLNPSNQPTNDLASNSSVDFIPSTNVSDSVESAN